ncbi:MAG: tRNA (adenosine(37)-N6)-threonylcarbamoyltransferase complex dimerization subunit type 1 TsaB [Planctomycetota bacterium]|nr:tRNA (adenosine(37)-N6)-threonylcarbamoyltransferase complex dimerization subunit type 1 TsaB [Planctomycetota bacterium]
MIPTCDLNRMKILALETSERRGTIAACDADNCLARLNLPEDSRTAESLLVGIEQTLDRCRWTPADIDLIAVTQGPGSFTGLRIGCVTAKVLAYATGAQLVGVNTHQAIAWNLTAGSPLWCVIDAGRNQCYAARYAMTSQGPEELIGTAILNIDDWIAQLEKGDRVSGTLLAKFDRPLPAGVTAVDAENWAPRAEAVAEIGRQAIAQGQSDSHWEFSPHYYRLSAAEEKRQSTAAD